MTWLPVGGALAFVGLLVTPLLAAVASPAPHGLQGRVPTEWADVVAAAAASCPDLPAAVLAAQLQHESGWNPRAVSTAGAQGLAQFMPITWASFAVDANGDARADPFDPVDAIWTAARYDCHLLTVVRRLPGVPIELMLAAYNAGPSRVLEAGGIPPITETQAYVRAVTASAAKGGTTAGGAEGLTPRAAEVRRVAMETFGVTDIGGLAQDGHVAGSDHYTGRAVDIMLTPLSPQQTERGWTIALYLQSNAQRLGITYLIWQGRIWSIGRAAEGWRPYRHPSGGLSPTLQHLDHIHVSVA